MTMTTESHHTSVNLAPSYIDCNGSNTSHLQGIWTEFDSSSENNTSIAPYLLTHTSSEQSEQSTQCLALSPTELFWDCVPESSMGVKQLGDDILWPMLRSSSFQWQQNVSLEHRATEPHDTELHGNDGEMVTDHSEANDKTPRTVVNPRPSKRKRGRPRLSFPQSEVRSGNMSQSQLSSARRSQLEKNRIAAAECRERSKHRTAEMVARASDLSSKNKALRADETALREQIIELKNEVLRHAGCGSWAIDGYVSQCAGDILGVKAPLVQTLVSRRDSTQTQCLDGSTKLTDNFACETVSESPIGQDNIDSSELDDYESLRLFNIYEDMDRQQKWDIQHP